MKIFCNAAQVKNRAFVIGMMALSVAAVLSGVIMIVNSLASPAFADEAATKWECEKKSRAFEGKGAWKEAVRAYTNGNCSDDMSCRATKKVESTYTGELKVSIPKLESFALMTHKINKSFSVCVKYKTSLKNRKKGTWAIQYRPVYNCRKVTQRKCQKVDKHWQKTSVTKTVKTKDYKSMSYRVVYLSAKDKTGIGKAKTGKTGIDKVKIGRTEIGTKRIADTGIKTTGPGMTGFSLV